MLIFIENTPRAYAWGSRDALPELLGVAPTGEPQAELWLGDHPGAPASVAKARRAPQTLIDLIESDPERYGVDGAPGRHLPFLLKVLGIGAPLSLQVHPDKGQAEAGFAREEEAGLPRDARERNYGDPNHKPELLVALSEVSALCGFRPLVEARADLLALAAVAPDGAGRDALDSAARRCAAPGGAEEREARSSLLGWALGGDGAEAASAAARAIAEAVASMDDGRPGDEDCGSVDGARARIAADRLRSLRELTDAHPGDPGVLISLLLHLVTLQPGQAVYLSARQLHAYLGGIAVEVMAASDNVLRAGLTEKHVDAAEVLRIVDMATLDSPRLEPVSLAPGLIAWRPGVPDFVLKRARLGDPRDCAAHDELEEREDDERLDRAESVLVESEYPTVLVAVEGRVRVERVGAELSEVASVGRGQSLYVSAGEPIEISGLGEVFLATVGEGWPSVSQPSSEG